MNKEEIKEYTIYRLLQKENESDSLFYQYHEELKINKEEDENYHIEFDEWLNENYDELKYIHNIEGIEEKIIANIKYNHHYLD